MTSRSLWRNRDFLLLEVGQLLSGAGSQLTAFAYPLLALDLTGSSVLAGLVATARLLPHALFGPFAGLAADRLDRKVIMLVADGVRALAVAGLLAALALAPGAFWPVPVVAFVEGAGSCFFAAALAGALRAVVPARQLPAAIGAQGAGRAAISLAGPPLGGLLFGLGRAIPFLADVVSYAFSLASLAAMRTPFQEEREVETGSLRARLVEGARFLWQQPFLRSCALLYGMCNLIGPGVLFALVVIGRRQGLPDGELGALTGLFGACFLVGALASPLVRRACSVGAILRLELWAWVGCAGFLVWPSVHVLAVGAAVVALAIPSTDSVVNGYRLAMTPDRLLGRVESARSTISLLIAPLGPIGAGLLLDATSARATIAVFAGFALLLALWGTLSPALRGAPSLDELDSLTAREP